jgi:hypothetical protein
MMSDYKVIYRADKNSTGEDILHWEPPCPVLIEAVQISRNTITTKTFLQLKIKNISGKTINAVYGQASITLNDNSTDEVTFDSLDFDALQGQSITINPIELPHADIKNIYVKVIKTTSQEDTWQTANKDMSLPGKKEIELSSQAKWERERLFTKENIDKSAINGAVQDYEKWWVCACGKINVDADRCWGCKNSKNQLKSLEDEDSLIRSGNTFAEPLYENAKLNMHEGANQTELKIASENLLQISGWQDAKALLDECNKKIEEQKLISRKKKSKIALISVCCITVVALAILLATFVVIPQVKYSNALSKAESGQYEEAIEALESLDGYSDSLDKIVEIKYKWADWSTENNDFENAVSIYNELGDTEASKKAKYDYVQQHLDTSDSATYRYLGELIKNNYSNSKEIYENLYHFSAELYFNDSRSDTNTKTSAFMVNYDIFYIWAHIKLQGNYPPSSVKLNITTDSYNSYQKMWMDCDPGSYTADTDNGSCAVRIYFPLLEGSLGSYVGNNCRVTVYDDLTGDLLAQEVFYVNGTLLS